MPGPLYLIRAWRKRARRVRRYSQIGRILVRRGMLLYLRGTRRSELHTRDGRAALAGSLRLALEDGGVTFIKLGFGRRRSSSLTAQSVIGAASA
jgi:ubiquinone biosynthesis protein